MLRNNYRKSEVKDSLEIDNNQKNLLVGRKRSFKKTFSGKHR